MSIARFMPIRWSPEARAISLPPLFLSLSFSLHTDTNCTVYTHAHNTHPHAQSPLGPHTYKLQTGHFFCDTADGSLRESMWRSVSREIGTDLYVLLFFFYLKLLRVHCLTAEEAVQIRGHRVTV